MRFKSFGLLLTFAILFTSCARQISSDVYSARQVGEASITYSGFIKSVRIVTVDSSDYLENNTTGIAGGGLAGGVLGSAIGNGHFLPTAAGAVAGAVTGAFVEKKMKQQEAFEYIVDLDNGGMMTVVQGLDQPFAIGQPVYVIVSPFGRSRIISQ